LAAVVRLPSQFTERGNTPMVPTENGSAAPGAALVEAVSEYVQSLDARFDGLKGFNGLRDPSLISEMLEKRIKDMDVVTESDLEAMVESAVEDQLRNADFISEYDVDEKISDAVGDIDIEGFKDRLDKLEELGLDDYPESLNKAADMSERVEKLEERLDVFISGSVETVKAVDNLVRVLYEVKRAMENLR